jgi:uncharacterized membrane protein
MDSIYLAMIQVLGSALLFFVSNLATGYCFWRLRMNPDYSFFFRGPLSMFVLGCIAVAVADWGLKTLPFPPGSYNIGFGIATLANILGAIIALSRKKPIQN